MDVHSIASEGRFSAFMTYLNTCPDVCAHIQDLAFRCDLSGSFDQNRAEVVNVIAIHLLLSKLPKLRNLTLSGVSLQPKPLNGHDLPLASLPHLHALHITGCHFHDEDMTLALDVVRMFVAVDELSFGGFWSMEHARSSSVTQRSHTMIQHIHYDTLGAEPAKMLSKLLQTSPTQAASLQSLHFTWSSWAEVQEYEKIIGDATLALQRLELEPKDQFWEYEAPEDVTRWHKLGLTRCVRLESLHLYFRYSHLSYLTDGHKLFYVALAAYTHILARNPPPSLRYLTLQIPIYLREGGGEVIRPGALWDDMDAAMSQVHTLISVNLVIRSLGPLAKATEAMLSLGFQRVLERTHAKGILSVQYQGALEVDPSDFPPIPLPPGRTQTPPYTSGEV
ncbi:hypothetical protein BC628DRAFT_1422103 [Trametes gibbosa]|nr:hypothetical protein BC628DRAFT_1422103 [Trametes gibbosa]